ncbi:hypothetical protein CEUSTIGMA_g12014.t1 [Chlamydomonas eustigma]|uniref:RING-type E3 ubiquitin transferase n=1 Tax=Chlamydomonas eustigma TaxID=1157962 RepID=A0A250XNM6_9CHLO|nr:hypothetical protein CEUSTIGMA_g12014.t1 [Chlamydomonas eustigma]|eukprot:GAX84593.1 hypothetical protein CEUSTIGMA_g12014.t1 [Chlamydomonas eustigma]
MVIATQTNTFDWNSIHVSLGSATICIGAISYIGYQFWKLKCRANEALARQESFQARTPPRKEPQPNTPDDDAGLYELETEIPDEFKDPITLGIIQDPVILCPTGQVYCYSTLRQWFATGNRLCPRTNITLNDVQVTRAPWLRQMIKEFCETKGLEFGLEDISKQRLAEIDANLPGWITCISSDSGPRRMHAVSLVYNFLRSLDVQQPEKAMAHKLIRSAVLDDMVWLLRYGDPHSQGLAASIAAYCDTCEEVQWLSAVATIPAVVLCSSPNTYTSQAATRLLYNLARAGPSTRTMIGQAGGHKSLLNIVCTERSTYGYSRERAAGTLAALAKDADILVYLKEHAFTPLRNLFISSDDRWEKRESASALLKIFKQEELGEGLSTNDLLEHWWCSSAWLLGGVSDPSQGHTLQEVEARSSFEAWLENTAEQMTDHMIRDLIT